MNSEYKNPDANEITNWLLSKLSETLRVQPEQIDINEPFSSYGLTSIAAVSLTGDLEEWLDRPLAATLAFDYPTVSTLSNFLANDPKDPKGGSRS